MAHIVVKFDDGSELTFLPRRVEALDGALPEDLSAIEITETGLHLRWPRLGIDLYVPGLIAGDPRRLLSRTDL